MGTPTEEFLTAEEAAERLGVTRSYLYRLIKRGLLPEALGIRGGREVKLIPASALDNLDAAEGLLVRDVGEAPAGHRPATDRPVTRPPQAPDTATSLTGQSPSTGPEPSLLHDLRSELRALRQQLAEERSARQQLEARLAAQPQSAPEAEHDYEQLASAISRANEVTALVKTSELKHQRFFEQLLEQQRWGRAKRLAYIVYLAIASAAGIAIIVWVYKLARHFEALLAAP